MILASYKARVLEAAAGNHGSPVSPAGHPLRVGVLVFFLSWPQGIFQDFYSQF